MCQGAIWGTSFGLTKDVASMLPWSMEVAGYPNMLHDNLHCSSEQRNCHLKFPCEMSSIPVTPSIWSPRNRDRKGLEENGAVASPHLQGAPGPPFQRSLLGHFLAKKFLPRETVTAVRRGAIRSVGQCLRNSAADHLLNSLWYPASLEVLYSMI